MENMGSDLMNMATGAVVGTALCVGLATIWLPVWVAVPLGGVIGVIGGAGVGAWIGDLF